jgi:hypothetical protein
VYVVGLNGKKKMCSIEEKYRQLITRRIDDVLSLEMISRGSNDLVVHHLGRINQWLKMH